MTMTPDRPKPGSDAAIADGCKCAVMDNNHGKWPPYPANETEPEGWFITQGCPIHDSYSWGLS